MKELASEERLLNDLVVIDTFLPNPLCRELVAVHRRFTTVNEWSDNGLYVPDLRYTDPAAFQTAKSVIDRMIDLVDAHFQKLVWCDLALICAITGSFRHRLHADNAFVFCPRHGADPERLLELGCDCEDIEVRPNHTPWRNYTGLLYLDSDHGGGDIVFGEAPNVIGKLYRKEITVRSGLLVLSPSNELYHHRTTPVSRGIRYSLNVWFTSETDRICRALV